MGARLWGVLTIAVALYLALGLIDLTLLSNMDRFWAVLACLVFVGMVALVVWAVKRAYFSADDGDDAPKLTITVTVDDSAAAQTPETTDGDRRVMWL